MSDVIDALARALARKQARAVTTRSTRQLTDDPDPVFGISLVRIVSEDVVQALAYGDLDPSARTQPSPTLLPRWNPLSRDASDLLPFAAALDDYLQRCQAAGTLPRIWVAHRPALALLDLLGRRYEHNSTAPPELHRMGGQCRVLATEATYPGQQVVAVAAELLRQVVVTGQTPTEDAHLGSLLTWVDPPAGAISEQVQRLADERALVPATGVLPNLPGDKQDDRVEALRRTAKRPGPQQRRAKAELEALLSRAAQAEWSLLNEARNAFLALDLAVPDRASAMQAASAGRIEFALDVFPSSPRHAPALSRLLDAYEHNLGLADDAAAHGDAMLRERQRRAGRAIGGMVIALEQPRRGQRPCRLLVRTTQPVLRARIGSRLSPADRRFVGTVTDITTDASGATTLQLDAVGGNCNIRERPDLHWVGDWVAAASPDLAFQRGEAYRAMADAADPALVPGPLPATAIRPLPPGFVAGVLAQRRP